MLQISLKSYFQNILLTVVDVRPKVIIWILGLIGSIQLNLAISPLVSNVHIPWNKPYLHYMVNLKDCKIPGMLSYLYILSMPQDEMFFFAWQYIQDCFLFELSGRQCISRIDGSKTFLIKQFFFCLVGFKISWSRHTLSSNVKGEFNLKC